MVTFSLFSEKNPLINQVINSFFLIGKKFLWQPFYLDYEVLILINILVIYLEIGC